MDYNEIQLEELEALQAIYPNELKIINREYPNINVSFYFRPNENEETSDIFDILLVLKFPKNYPNDIPLIELENHGKNNFVEEEKLKNIINNLCIVANENIGMPMAFNIISSLQDEIGYLIDDIKVKMRQADEKIKEEEEALERKKFEGTKVTVETFMKWKENFDREMNTLKERQLKEKMSLGGKLTGRQQFLNNSALNNSDIELINNVEIDESLFEEELDDLNIEGSDLE
ncbi:unnamed protein product [Dracunculus medinensis]|uniref:RWD domain-containing protein n=1 Tax=Dracunculus medinensis TaxID=318479 RepID=A0A0N4U7G4_DRAME|nr:unnamed protein product [Dracunculus medinensis]